MAGWSTFEDFSM